MKNKLIIATLSILISSAIFTNSVVACAPFFPSDVYETEEILKDYYPLMNGFIISETAESHPILNQKYEIITPGWGPEYLLPVFMSSENKEFSSEIKNRLYQYYKGTVWDEPNYQPTDTNQESVDKWLEIRNIYIKESYSGGKYFLIENTLISCADRALDRAVEDYEYRKSKFSDTELENWVKSQDKVFENCFIEEVAPINNISKTQTWWQSIIIFFKNINKKPNPPDSISASELLRYDQEYQQAAGAYYSKNYSLAITLFKEISNKKSHPHRQLAALSLGWSFIGRDIANYEIELKAEKPNAKANYIKNLQETQKYYEEMLSNPDYSSVELELQKYLDFVTFRTNPVKRLVDTEKTLLNPNDVDEFSRQLEDFTRIWYKYFHRVLFYQKDEPQHQKFSDQIVKSQSSFLRFLLEWEKPTSEGLRYSLENYKANGSPLWLILAVRQSNVGQDDFGFIKDEIGKIKPDSPFYLTAQYYWLEQLAKNQGSIQESKDIAEKFIKKTYDNNQLVAFNLFSDIRENLASNPKDTLKYSVRYSLTVYDKWWDNTPSIPYYSYENIIVNPKKYPLFSNKAKLYLGNLNSKELAESIVENSDVILDSMERYLKLTSFYRLLVLDDLESADLLAKNVVATDSNLSSPFSQYLNAKDPSTKKFMAAKILIDYPLVYPQIGENFDDFANMSIINLTEIDHYRRNWSLKDTCTNPKYRSENYFETDIDKEVNKNLDNFLSKILLDYMIQNPNSLDSKLLHQIVDFSHVSACQNEETSDIAKQAFQLLHNNYPESYWAKQTPYWY